MLRLWTLANTVLKACLQQTQGMRTTPPQAVVQMVDRQCQLLWMLALINVVRAYKGWPTQVYPLKPRQRTSQALEPC